MLSTVTITMLWILFSACDPYICLEDSTRGHQFDALMEATVPRLQVLLTSPAHLFPQLWVCVDASDTSSDSKYGTKVSQSRTDSHISNQLVEQTSR